MNDLISLYKVTCNINLLKNNNKQNKLKPSQHMKPMCFSNDIHNVFLPRKAGFKKYI